MTEELSRRAAAAAEAVYRITDLASFDAALKFILRKRAMEFVSQIAAVNHYSSGKRKRMACERLSGIAAAMESLIRFAEKKSLVIPAHAEKIVGAYAGMREEIFSASAGLESGSPADDIPPAKRMPAAGQDYYAAGRLDLNDRQKRIIKYLGESGQAQISSIRQMFGEAYSEKTLQRDLWQLVNFGLIRRQGDNRWTVYLPR